jgi:hypothetical protein
MMDAGLIIAATLIAFYLVFFVFFPLGRGAIYVPSSRAHAMRMAELAEASAGDKAVDLGSGDGRVVIALARKGAEAHGYEINPALALLSLRRIRRAGLTGKAHVHWGSFWRADLSRFHAVTVFQGSFVMRRLERKLLRELPEGSRVVSDYWRFPTMVPESITGTFYSYRMGPREKSARGASNTC